MVSQLDPVLLGLDADLKLVGSEEDEQALKQQIKAREDALLPMYMQVSTRGPERLWPAWVILALGEGFRASRRDVC